MPAESAQCQENCSRRKLKNRRCASSPQRDPQATRLRLTLELVRPHTLAPSAMRVLGGAATAAASALGHNYVGTEHLLLALCAQRDPLIGQILIAVGASSDAVQAKVFELLPESNVAGKS